MMYRKLKKSLVYLIVFISVFTALTILILFISYNNFFSHLDKNEIAKYSTKIRLRRTAGAIYRIYKDRPLYKNYINSLDIKPDDNVLDFGAGTGNEAVFLAERLLKGSGKLTCMNIDMNSTDF